MRIVLPIVCLSPVPWYTDDKGGVVMDCLQAISTRRSIRKFKPDPVPEEDLMTILEAGRLAPSAGNLQPWYFIVVRDEGIRRRLQLEALNQKMLGEAPVVIAVCTDPYRSARYGDRGVRFYSLLDGASAAQNILLAAHALGYGGCWVGAFRDKGVKAVLGLPEDFRVIALIPLGRPAEAPRMPRRRPLEEIVYWEKWQSSTD